MSTATERDGLPTPRRKRPRSSSESGRTPAPATTRSGAKGGKKKPPPEKQSLGRRLWRWTRRALIAIVVLVVLGALGLGGLLWFYSRDLPEIDALRNYQPPQVTRVVDRDGELIGESWQERRTVVPIERVPRVLVLSVLAAEDADFYRHRGLDYAGLIRAAVHGILSGHFRGTSTITQQVIKNLVLSPERTLSRKIRELLLARRLEQELTKEEILELYLNHVNFGHGRYGVQEASHYYFDKDVDDLTLAEASLLAGIPQSPTHLSPRTHPEAARRRQRFVLDQLAQKRAEYWPDLSMEEIEAARAATVEIVPVPDNEPVAPEVMAYAQRLLRDEVGEEAARRGGYTIHTTIDRELELAARAALRHGLEAVDERQHLRVPLTVPRRARALRHVDALEVGRTYDAQVTGADDAAGLVLLDVGGHRASAELEELARWNPDHLPASRIAEVGARVRVSIQELPPDDDPDEPARARMELGPEGAIVVIDPRTRDVLAIVGSYEQGPGFDRATRAVRQPGSTFKAFVYGLALRHGFTPATMVIDAPAVYDNWRPNNYEQWSFEGEIRLREGLAQSINQVAGGVLRDIGYDQAERDGHPIARGAADSDSAALTVGAQALVQFAQQFGITTELDPVPALALGASDVRPIELVNAYATFAAGGRWAPARLISRIEGPSGHDVALPEPEAPRDVMTPAEAYVLTNMLTSVVEHGTATRARALHRAVAGKTGTSNDARDAWFVGYSPETVAGVWVGYDDRRPLGRRESGGRTALPIWVDVMRTATERRPDVGFPIPSGVVTARIDPATGLLAYEGQADTMEEVFLEGSAPTETAQPPDVLDPNRFLMEQMGGGTESAPEDAP